MAVMQSWDAAAQGLIVATLTQPSQACQQDGSVGGNVLCLLLSWIGDWCSASFAEKGQLPVQLCNHYQPLPFVFGSLVTYPSSLSLIS